MSKKSKITVVICIIAIVVAIGIGISIAYINGQEKRPDLPMENLNSTVINEDGNSNTPELNVNVEGGEIEELSDAELNGLL